MSNDSDMKTGTFIYIGRRPASGYKNLYYEFLETDQPNDFRPVNRDRANSSTFTKLPRGFFLGNPGSVYTIEYKENEGGTRTFYFGTAKLLGRWNNDSDVGNWQQDSESAETAYNVSRRNQKKSKEDVFRGDLEKLRKFYIEKRTTKERAAFLALVIEAITNGRV